MQYYLFFKPAKQYLYSYPTNSICQKQVFQKILCHSRTTFIQLTDYNLSSSFFPLLSSSSKSESKPLHFQLRKKDRKEKESLIFSSHFTTAPKGFPAPFPEVETEKRKKKKKERCSASKGLKGIGRREKKKIWMDEIVI